MTIDHDPIVCPIPMSRFTQTRWSLTSEKLIPNPYKMHLKRIVIRHTAGAAFDLLSWTKELFDKIESIELNTSVDSTSESWLLVHLLDRYGTKIMVLRILLIAPSSEVNITDLSCIPKDAKLYIRARCQTPYHDYGKHVLTPMRKDSRLCGFIDDRFSASSDTFIVDWCRSKISRIEELSIEGSQALEINKCPEEDERHFKTIKRVVIQHDTISKHGVDNILQFLDRCTVLESLELNASPNSSNSITTIFLDKFGMRLQSLHLALSETFSHSTKPLNVKLIKLKTFRCKYAGNDMSSVIPLFEYMPNLYHLEIESYMSFDDTRNIGWLCILSNAYIIKITCLDEAVGYSSLGETFVAVFGNQKSIYDVHKMGLTHIILVKKFDPPRDTLTEIETEDRHKRRRIDPVI